MPLNNTNDRTVRTHAAGLDPSSAAGKAFSWLYASEQGWPSPACCDDRIRARNICFAHALSSTLPEMIGVTHNYFQDSPGRSEYLPIDAQRDRACTTFSANERVSH